MIRALAVYLAVAVPVTALVLCAVMSNGGEDDSSPAASVGPLRRRDTGRGVAPPDAPVLGMVGSGSASRANHPSTPGRFQLIDCPHDARSCFLWADLGTGEARCETHGTDVAR